jgi:hypothetical protein
MNTPAIPPPPATPREDRPSDASEVKIHRGHDATVPNLGLGLMLTAAFLCRPDFRVDWYIGAMLAGFGVVNLPVVWRRPPGSVGGVTLLLAGGKYVAHALALFVARHGGPFMVAAMVLLGGCTGDTRPVIQDARIAANKLGDALNRMRPALAAVCMQQPAPPPECSEALQSYNDVQTAYELAQAVIDTAAAVEP